MRSYSGLPALLLLLAGLLVLPGCPSRDAADAGPASEPERVTVAPPAADDGDGAEDLGGEGFGQGDIAEGEVRGTDDDAFDPNRVMLQPIYFAFDSSALSDVALRTLEENARTLKGSLGVRVVIEGHCDERGTTEYNLELGARRARSVRDQLERLGVSGDRLETISYGEERPVDPGHSESAWAKNRRAEFRVESM